MREATTKSIVNLMKELGCVVDIAKQEEDEADLLAFILEELKIVFRREDDVQMLGLWSRI